MATGTLFDGTQVDLTPARPALANRFASVTLTHEDVKHHDWLCEAVYTRLAPPPKEPAMTYPQTRIEEIARVAHEVNRAYCASLGDCSQKPWSEAPQWQRDSAIYNVRFHLANPYATPEDSHQTWMEEKRAAGWTYAPVKDEAKKEHPCFRPYSELPPEQRAKDYLFRGVIHAMR